MKNEQVEIELSQAQKVINKILGKQLFTQESEEDA